MLQAPNFSLKNFLEMAKSRINTDFIHSNLFEYNKGKIADGAYLYFINTKCLLENLAKCVLFLILFRFSSVYFIQLSVDSELLVYFSLLKLNNIDNITHSIFCFSCSSIFNLSKNLTRNTLSIFLV